MALALVGASAHAQDAPAEPQPEPRAEAPLVEPSYATALIRDVLAAVNHGNWTGNYTVLRDIAATHGADRGWFAVGAVIASVVWFFSLAFGARLLSRVLATPRAWRVLDAVIAVVMITLAVLLALGA